MANRNTLTKAHVKPFQLWLYSVSIPFRVTGADYQVMQVKLGSDWVAIYERHGKEHLTVPDSLHSLVRRFMRTLSGGQSVAQTETTAQLASCLTTLGNIDDALLAIAKNEPLLRVDAARQHLAGLVAILNREVEFLTQTGA